MSAGLYELLGLSSDATPEQIRKAYKKKALLTHPDRLPPGATPEEKAASEEGFRKVNNAYEVLIDPNKRQEYDVRGVWPPPEEPPSPHWSTTAQHGSQYSRPHRSHTFPDPFFSHGSAFHPFHFTDPFALFEEIFAGTPFARSSRHRHPFFNPSFQQSPFDRMQADIEAIMNEFDRGASGMRSIPSFGPVPAFPMIASSSFGENNRGRWVSESFSSSTINGVTQSIHRRVDLEGNEHVTRTFSDGRQVRSINGVEQPTHPHAQIAYPSQSRDLRQEPQPLTNRYLPAPPPAIPQSTRADYGVPTPQSYPGPQPGYYDAPRHEHHRHRHHLLRSREKSSYHPSEPSDGHQEKHYRKWWQTRH